MILTILLGFSDAQAQTLPRIISGFDATPLEQINIFNEAKDRHKFPDGVKCLVRANVELTDRAIFINDGLAGQIERADKQRAIEDSKRSAAAKEITKSQIIVQTAWAKVRDTAKKRNDLMGRLNSEKAKLQAHEATPESLRDKKTWKSGLDAIRLLILGDPASNVAGLESQVAAAVVEYDKAMTEYDALIKPAKESAPVSQLA